MSLFVALLATLQQGWARRYLGLTRPHVAIHKRAHIRSFFAESVSRLHVTVEVLLALLHISVFLFLAGLVISLFTIHHTVAYVILSATVVCFLSYAAITVMPIICHDSPYASPLSTPVWCITQKIALAVFKAVGCVVDSLRIFEHPLGEPPGKIPYYKLLLHGSITSAIYISAMRPDSQRDARALGWTLDRLDEEGELVQFAAGIPGFSLSTKVKESVSILEKTPMSSQLHRDLSRHIALLLMRAFKPGLLPESVRKQRVAICLEALYYLPHALKALLQIIANNIDRPIIVRGLSPALLSVESWLIAERLSVANTSILDRAVKIGAQCMATVIASQPPPDEQSRSILMRHLRIEELLLNRYLEPFDSLLLKNLNLFLKNTAFDVISDEDAQHHIDIVLLTVRLAKRLKIEHATQELRDEFERLRARIQQYATESSGKARDNAENLFSELCSLTDYHPEPPPNSVTLYILSGQRPLQPVLQPPNDVYISILDSPPVAQNDTLPTTPLSPSINSGSRSSPTTLPTPPSQLHENLAGSAHPPPSKKATARPSSWHSRTLTDLPTAPSSPTISI